MSKLFYSKLAIMNIKKNNKTYLPFVITSICTIIMFYIMHSISINKGLDGGSGSESLKIILSLGTIVIGIFSAIFLFYTNSFLIKRRKKEIGLYNVLGLGKKHIAKVLFLECIITSLVSLVVGLLGGIVLNKLMFLLLLKLLHFEVSFGFSISLPSIIRTLIVFGGIFSITLLSNLFQIKISNPIALLKGTEHGEKEPKTKWIITIIGLIALSTGYGIALSVKSPLTALNLFFIAVILVMIGTYSLFTAGSIVALKLLRKNKKFYYKTKNFISISGMLYRMKQNAVGLANICILSTTVLVMLSTTVSLYVGMEDALRSRYPREILIKGTEINESQAQKLEEILANEIKADKVNIENKLNYWSSGSAFTKEDHKFLLSKGAAYNSDFCMLVSMKVSDYNRLEEKNVKLNDDEVVIFSTSKSYGKDTITIGDKTFKVKEEIDTILFGAKQGMDIVDTYVVFSNNMDSIGINNNKIYSVGFDVEGTDEDIMLLSNKLNQRFMENNITARIESVTSSRKDFLSIHGGLFFLGIFLGSLFLMATVLIIYYKQISEGYDDKDRFGIMQKVGMSKIEIKKTIRSQVLMVFFLPLITTMLHIAFAFPMITKLLIVLNLTNVSLFMICTIITSFVFAVIYGIVFSLTARAYYKIVE